MFYVTEDMATLARTAGQSLPDFHLDREDLPAPGGFMLFASPIGSYLIDEGEGVERAFITANSWGVSRAFGLAPRRESGSRSGRRNSHHGSRGDHNP